MSEYFKLVARRGDQRVSVAVKGKYGLVYVPGEWVEPVIGLLFVFGNLEFARWSARARAVPIEIWKVEVGRVFGESRFAPDPTDVEFDQVAEFWWAEDHWRNYTDLHKLPVVAVPLGTLMTDRVKLIRQIW